LVNFEIIIEKGDTVVKRAGQVKMVEGVLNWVTVRPCGN
jgi:hypothetical protein